MYLCNLCIGVRKRRIYMRSVCARQQTRRKVMSCCWRAVWSLEWTEPWQTERGALQCVGAMQRKNRRRHGGAFMTSFENEKHRIEKATVWGGWKRNVWCWGLSEGRRDAGLARGGGGHGAQNHRVEEGDGQGNNNNNDTMRRAVKKNRRDYHDVSKQWSVPRTALKYYPEETRMVIQGGSKSGRQSNEEKSVDDVAKCVHMVQKSLEYEEKQGFCNFQGRNGQFFSAWIAESLASLSYCDTMWTTSEERMLDELLRMAKSYELKEKNDRREFVEECKGVCRQLEHHAGIAAGVARQTETHDSGRIDPAVNTNDTRESATKSRRKPSTVEFRRNFIETALSAPEDGPGSGVNVLQGKQRTDLWRSLRDKRLTASAFSKALGFFSGDRISLWEEKIGLREPFKGNDATRWGTASEPKALATYEALTGQGVESCMFKVKRDDVVHDWLGASPDGLVAGLGIPKGSAAHIDGPGILEIKCPYNKGHPELAQPPKRAIWYYMPQIQGLMDVFDREWCCLYIWTSHHGSSSFVIPRNREYWSTCFDVLAEFWWAHTIPARQARDNGAQPTDIAEFSPSEVHPSSEKLKQWSKDLAWSAPGTVFPHVDLDQEGSLPLKSQS